MNYMKSFNEFRLEQLTEASLSRIVSHVSGRNIGLLSAHRGENSDEENRKNSAELKDAIRSAGYGHNVVHGVYTENKGTPHEKTVHEHSYLVIGDKGDDGGKLKKFLTQQGKKFKQDSVLHKAHNEENAHLIGTSDTSTWLKKGESHSVGKFHPSRSGEFHSALKNGKTFTFESVEIVNPDTFFSAWIQNVVK